MSLSRRRHFERGSPSLSLRFVSETLRHRRFLGPEDFGNEVLDTEGSSVFFVIEADRAERLNGKGGPLWEYAVRILLPRRGVESNLPPGRMLNEHRKVALRKHLRCQALALNPGKCFKNRRSGFCSQADLFRLKEMLDQRP